MGLNQKRMELTDGKNEQILQKIETNLSQVSNQQNYSEFQNDFLPSLSHDNMNLIPHEKASSLSKFLNFGSISSNEHNNNSRPDLRNINSSSGEPMSAYYGPSISNDCNASISQSRELQTMLKREKKVSKWSKYLTIDDDQ